MFTFKTEKPTGEYRSFQDNIYLVKMNKKLVGRIVAKDFSIMLMIEKNDINEDKNPNCSWKWITLKYKPLSLDGAKKYLNVNFDLINKTYKLHLI